MKGEVLVGGTAAGALLFSPEPLSFWGGYDPETGEIIDRRHDLSGRNGQGCILAIPGTRGSSTTTAVLLESVRRETAPAGFLVTDRDTFLALASVVADEMYDRVLPVIRVDPGDFERLKEANAAEIKPDGSIDVLQSLPDNAQMNSWKAAPVIDIQNATVFREDTRVFDGLTLKIENGIHTAILGPNGAGKSTLLRLLTRDLFPVVKPGSHVRIWGQDRWETRRLRAQLGIVSHDLQTSYKRWVSGREVVLSGFDASVGLWPHQSFDERQTARADEVMAQLGILTLANRPLESMSTGEQRRFVLARALVHDPAVLVLDEPTSGLDLKACFQYIDTIRQLMHQGKTIVLVTHHVHEIPPEIERVVFLKAGRIVSDGASREQLTTATLRNLFDTPLEVLESGGFYQVFPAN